MRLLRDIAKSFFLLMHSVVGGFVVYPIYQTFDLRWTNRFSFRFGAGTACDIGLAKVQSGVSGTIVLPDHVASFDPSLGSGDKISRCFCGRYQNDACRFSERSLTIELGSRNSGQVIEFAAKIASETDQQMVLVWDRATAEIYLLKQAVRV